jgi:ubiquinone/menaquinone biosynthesis C-methylase UbiE
MRRVREGSSSMADDAVRSRFARSARRVAERQDARAAEFGDAVRAFVLPRGDERALDVGTGAGALALALAPHVREVVGVDVVPELLELARERAPGNATFLEGDATGLDVPAASFDLAGTVRTLHHIARPELVVAELTRVTRPGGHVLVVDQLAPTDPLAAVDLDRFERARDPSHTRLLPDADMRGLFDANGLVLLREETHLEDRDLDAYLDLAVCEGEAREAALALAPNRERSTASIGWYLLRRS